MCYIRMIHYKIKHHKTNFKKMKTELLELYIIHDNYNIIKHITVTDKNCSQKIAIQSQEFK